MMASVVPISPNQVIFEKNSVRHPPMPSRNACNASRMSISFLDACFGDREALMYAFGDDMVEWL
jgi:hypothetical protein